MEMVRENTVTDSSRAVLEALVESVPDHLSEVQKQQFIVREILERLNQDTRDVLRELVDDIILRMRDYGASDIEIGGPGTGGTIWLRIQGKKRPFDDLGQFSLNACNLLIQCLLSEEQRRVLDRERSLDFSYTVPGGATGQRYRTSIYYEMGDLALNMRAIGGAGRNYSDYNFSMSVTRQLSLTYTKQGLVLVTGITGSGKSTTLDAIVDMNNRSVEGHIVVIASPVEYLHASKKCIVRHREVGADTRSFKHGTIEALRQDPDIIVIGEMRDSDTILAGLEAADTGHKVFSTLHTGSATESVERIIAEVPAAEQDRVRYRLADVLSCVISQRLVPGTDGRLVLATEVLVMSPAIKAAIKNNNIGEIYQMLNEGEKAGMHTMEQDLYRLYRDRKISIETAFNFANHKRRMHQMLHAQ